MKAIDAKEKFCKNCKLLLPVENFYKFKQLGKQGQVWYYYDSKCKKCKLAYIHNRRLNLKKEAVNYLGSVCNDCGGTFNECVYDFHHIDPTKKDFELSDCTRSFTKYKTELVKCILLCANCHRIRHYK